MEPKKAQPKGITRTAVRISDLSLKTHPSMSLKVNTFKVNTFKVNTFKVNTFKVNTFKVNTFKVNTLKVNTRAPGSRGSKRTGVSGWTRRKSKSWRSHLLYSTLATITGRNCSTVLRSWKTNNCVLLLTNDPPTQYAHAGCSEK
ncbi:hypothetical protein GNI_046270 [Gregarina niphandrodes]|uniref:Uncharacterized protein n=1 Tax=Gregarina niphandrodes TaxID=110365 RepID=A0A023B9R3_GRENI|nr:hypothetical protein GNI_046270 [Gregarina niphandrodes]EZG75547.1 hypothetical protein GNI_046270 [Gregarina niphandrodes]|eukprot:XP_011129606.1 hypothetical protein GNI_046270 [Gregarina niphandrodes]